MIVASLEEFAPRRRSAQERVEGLLRPIVERALDGTVNTDGYAELLDEVRDQWKVSYTEESGGTKNPPKKFLSDIADTLAKTDKGEASKATVDRIVMWLATAVLSHSTMEATGDDEEFLLLEWVDMRDSKVRSTHAQAHGQQVEPGEKFKVGGAEMPYPGWPGVDIALWINCRCTVRPVMPQESLTAAFHREFVKHDVVFIENRRTPKVVTKGAKYEPKPSEGKITKRRAATEEEERTIARGDWVRVNEKGEKPSDSGYMEKKSKVRPQNNSLLRSEAVRRLAQGMDLPLSLLADPEWVETRSELGWSFADGYEGVTHAGLAVQASDTGRVLLMQRSLDPEDAPDVQGTWEFPGGGIDPEDDGPEAAARREFCEETGLDVPEGEVTGGWRSEDGVYQGFVLTVPIERDAFDGLNPDVASTANPDDPERERPEVTAWFSLEQIKAMGSNLRPEVHKTDWSQFSEGGGDLWHPETDESEEDDMTQQTDEKPIEQASTAVPWHGVLAPEDIKSGDGRGFRGQSLRNRPLPLPLTWQKISASGHQQAVTVARIDRIERVGGEARASGVMLQTAEADEVVGLVAEFGRFGVSVDADDVTMEASEEEAMWFSDARISGACIVPIPAFSEAWVSLGQEPEDFFEGGTPLATVGAEAPQESLVASVGVAESEMFVDIAPGKTEDGPGWLTHPVDTDRLRDYWVSGEGAAQIGWGAPGDFNRCRLAVAEYVKPQYLSGYCANRHYDALGAWPGQAQVAAETLGLTATEPAEPVNLVASAYGNLKAPYEWFSMPEPDKVTPLTITDDGQFYGHLAAWNVCHANVTAYGECFLAPKSPTKYSRFMLGYVETDAGPVATGTLTIGTGHANGRLSGRQAAAHYDNTGSAFADVRVMDGEHGIWACGWVRPGTSEEQVIAARASKMSGDWRMGPKGLDMIAALAVNSPGYEVTRIAASVQDGEVVSLVAAGMLEEQAANAIDERIDYERLASLVVKEMQAATERTERMAALAARFEKESF